MEEKERYALVTGGSRGIGRAVAVRLAQDGYSVIINYTADEPAALQAQEVIRNAGGTAELLRFDVSCPEQTEKAVADWHEKHPQAYIAVLVNNAGIRRDNLMVFMKYAD